LHHENPGIKDENGITNGISSGEMEKLSNGQELASN
jgi:hypothetical protein